MSSTKSLSLDEQLSKKRLSNLYSPLFLRLLQIIYGSENIISQGGIESIDVMFSGIDLNGKKILDIGSGFGGVDTYLAQKYHTDITGVDKEPYMVFRSQELLKKAEPNLKGKVVFQTLAQPANLKEFSDSAFDYVFSKEMLYHIPVEQKQSFIDEMHRVLKPGGTLIIADWLEGNPGNRLKQAVRIEGFCHFITPKTLCSMMQTSNFCALNYKDQTHEHIRYSNQDIARLQNAKQQVCQELGNDVFDQALTNWMLWLEAQQSHELLSGIQSGIKPIL